MLGRTLVAEEGLARIEIPSDIKSGPGIGKAMPVFYNPLMKPSRDITVLFIRALERPGMSACFPLAGSGVRPIRLLKELSSQTFEEVLINDINPKAAEAIRKNLRINRVMFQEQEPGEKDIKTNKIGEKSIGGEKRHDGRKKGTKKLQEKDDAGCGKHRPAVSVSSIEASQALLISRGFDYVDIDPFGSPNRFLDAAVRRIRRGGTLAVTATDTAPLCGTYPKACLRKYWARPSRGSCRHETGIRILIRKVQLIGAQYDRALLPVYSFSKDHYFRVFFRMTKGKKDVDLLQQKHGQLSDAGPLWTGPLWDKELSKRICELNRNPANNSLLHTIQREALLDGCPGFHDVHSLSAQHKLKALPKMEALLGSIRTRHPAERTHFSPYGIRSSIPEKELYKLMKGLIEEA